jgi:cytochrome c oxidase subunit II
MLSSLNILADTGGTFWQPPQASLIAPDVDWLFNFILAICVFFFVLIFVLLVVFAWKYRYREGDPPPVGPKHNTALELTWTFVPTVIVVVIFVYGFKGFMHMAIVPDNNYEIVVSARMWSYTFRYPNGHVDNTLHIPAETPVQLVLNSDDVIHGFYIPVFRIKKDDVPGRFNKIWVDADAVDPGKSATYDIFCTQFCGQGHSTMRSHVVVQTRDDFEAWLKNANIFVGTPAEHGKHIWETMGCNQCHTIDGSAGRGPTWKDVYGSMVPMKEGPALLADEDYLHGVITNPNSHQIPGFDPIMPPTQGLLSEKDVGDVIAFLKTLSKNYHPALPASAPAATPAK